MNIPVKIKNKTPIVSLSSFSELLLDKIDFSNLNSCKQLIDGYFSKYQINDIVKAIKTSTSLNTTLYEDTLEVFFYNLETTVDTLLDLLYLSNPVNIEDTLFVDTLLENSINKLTIDNQDIWQDRLIKKDLVGKISASFLDYDITVNSKTKTGQCKVMFRYLPDSTEKCILLDLKLNPDLIPETLISDSCRLQDLNEDLINHIKEEVEKTWLYFYDWKETIYQEELYRSIMSNKGGITIDDFYTKSFNYLKYSNKIDSRYIESLDNFSSIPEDYFYNYSTNIITCLAGNTFNKTTINPGFKHGISGWNRFSKKSNVDTIYLNLSNPENIKLENTIINSLENNAELIVDEKFNSFEQVNRVPEGLYDLTLSISTNVERDVKMYIGDVESTFTLPVNPNLSLVTLTDVNLGGIDLTNIPDGIINYGFEIQKITSPQEVETKIEYCRIIKK